jgi:hypothetical protein
MPHMLVLDHVSPATRLLEKRRQMFEVQEVLEHQKDAFNRKEEVFKRQEDGLKKKDLDLQESLIKFSKFLQENDSKISRAEKKSREEIALRLQKESEIAELQEKLQQLKAKCDDVHTLIEQNVKYQRYLESVVEADNDLPDIQEILNRCAVRIAARKEMLSFSWCSTRETPLASLEALRNPSHWTWGWTSSLNRYTTLITTNSDLKRQQNEHADAMERVRNDTQLFQKQKTDDILNMNNRIARLKKHLESIRLASADEEAVKDSALQVTSQNTLEYGQVPTRQLQNANTP